MGPVLTILGASASKSLEMGPAVRVLQKPSGRFSYTLIPSSQ